MGKSAVLVLALFSFLGPGLRHGAEPRIVQRRFTSELELATERFELTGTEDGQAEAQQPPAQVREQADEIELTDTLFDDEDPPAKFTRLYGTVMSSLQLGDERSPRTKTQSAGLEGKTVTFERERDGTYTRSCDDAEVRQGQLKRLRADLSLACLLPQPEEGDEKGDGEGDESWEIDSADLARLFSPIEDEVRRPRPKVEPPRGGLNLAPAAMSAPLGALFHALEGTMTATISEPSEGDELPRNARLEFRLTSTFDGSETLLPGLDTEAEDELELTYEGTGTLAWDPENGRIEVECEGDLRLTETFRAEVEGKGKSAGKKAEIKGELVLGGTLSVTGDERRAE